MTAPSRADGVEVTILRRIGALGLPGAEALPRDSLEDNLWRAVAARTRSERIEGLLAEAVWGGQLVVSDEQFDSVREMGRSRAQADLLLERECLRVGEILDEAQVPWRLVKGPALAHLVYSNPSLRGYGDVDLLVKPDCWQRCIEVLETSGARRMFPELRTGFDERFGKDATFASPGRAQIDLHRTFVLGPYGFWMHPDELFQRSHLSLDLAGWTIPTLSLEDSFLYACYSVVLADDPPRLLALRDVAEMACREDLDIQLLSSVARRWRAEPIVGRALELVESHLGADVGSTTVSQKFAPVRASRWERALIGSYHGPGRGYTSQLAGIVALPGIRLKARYVAALVLPQRSYLQARGFTAAGFLGNALNRVRGRA